MKWCNDGENIALIRLLTDYSALANLYLGLYMDTVEPAEDETLAGLTEPDYATKFSEGARIALAKASWTIVADTATHLLKTFTAILDVGNVYGYFITDAASGTVGKIYGVEHFADGPYNVLTGGLVKITPRIITS